MWLDSSVFIKAKQTRTSLISGEDLWATEWTSSILRLSPLVSCYALYYPHSTNQCLHLSDPDPLINSNAGSCYTWLILTMSPKRTIKAPQNPKLWRYTKPTRGKSTTPPPLYSQPLHISHGNQTLPNATSNRYSFKYIQSPHHHDFLEFLTPPSIGISKFRSSKRWSDIQFSSIVSSFLIMNDKQLYRWFRSFVFRNSEDRFRLLSFNAGISFQC